MNACVAAIIHSGNVYMRFESQVRGQAERLIPMCEELFAEANISPKDLQTIAVTSGPGAFTGLRVGLSAARIMALSLNIPVIGLSTCALLAFEAVQHVKSEDIKASSIAVVMETKRSDFYFAHYKSQDFTPLMSPVAWEKEQITAYIRNYADVFYCGDALKRFCAEKAEISDNSLDIIAANPLKCKEYIEREVVAYNHRKTTETAPVYLRCADVSSPKKIRQIEN